MRKLKYKLGFVALLCLIWYLFLKNENSKHLLPIPKSFEITSKCSCQREVVNVNRLSTVLIDTYNSETDTLTEYEVTNKEFESLILTCELYKALKRGQHQKVLSFSVNRSNQKYFNEFLKNIKSIQEVYPGWIIRVYHDNLIDQETVCQFECANSLIDFCRVNQLPNLIVNTVNRRHMLSDVWKWLPLGDDFVDAFIVKNIQSFLFVDEKNSVNEWHNKSSNLFYVVMGKIILNIIYYFIFHFCVLKDNLKEDFPGVKMWGHHNSISTAYSKYLYNMIISRSVSDVFHTEKDLFDTFYKSVFHKNASIYNGLNWKKQFDLF